ncbi:hypothetical protein FEK30_01030 (plasmid) [Picosynechococcus sp. PCC 11901]|uniref:hypothetical protein n=1 Tax=Picosynechococcus sp. PCC 11901 TaxID=2579791 RepID=UPI0010FC2482|nr:hypothetical protein [Picosynechococcus sp. PCC 11901]QCS48133.1 hypothetical protein FEK30_01030 [Picosynechococcus sp. PCC 11901]
MTALDILRQLSEMADRTAYSTTIGRYQFETQDLEVPYGAWVCWNTRYRFSFTAVVPGLGEICAESDMEFTQPLTNADIDQQWEKLAWDAVYFEAHSLEIKYPCCDFFPLGCLTRGEIHDENVLSTALLLHSQVSLLRHLFCFSLIGLLACGTGG